MSFRPAPVRWSSRRWWLRVGLIAAAVFTVAVLSLMAPVYLPRLTYDWLRPQPASSTSSGAAPAIVQPVTSEPTISIPKIGVSAPVVYEPSTAEAAVQKALQNGVVHYGTTPVPGQPGNVAIFGHSSNDWWKPGSYNRVFVLLDKMVAGDRIEITYQSVRYVYEVTGSKVVKPTDFSVLKASAQPTLSLITCTPIGTSLRRLVVTAKQVEPAPGATVQPVAASVVDQPSTNQTGSLAGSEGVTTTLWNFFQIGFDSIFGR